MILSTHGVLASSGGVAIDADAQAFFDRVTTAGGSLTNTEKTAVNNLVIALKANSLWTPMKAIYPMVGASAAACRQNLKSSSFTGTFTSGWTFASTGVTGNGTSAYFDTTLVPNSNLSLNSCSFSVYSRSNFTPTANNSYGCTSSGSYTPLLGSAFTTSKGVDSYAYGFGTDGMSSATGQNLAALFLTSRTSSSSAKLFRNSTSIATATTQGQTTQPTNSFTFGAFRNPGGFESYSSFQYAFAHIGDGLTDTQSSDFYTAVQAFQTTLSRQV